MTLWRLGVVAASKSGVNQFANGAYIMGGGSPGVRTNDKMIFSTETVTALSNTPPAFSTNYMSSYQSTTAGYMSGGDADTAAAKMPFATNTVSTLPTTLPVATNVNAQGSGGPDRGYHYGGFSGPTSSRITNIFKMTYSTDTLSNLPATLTTGSQQVMGFASPTNGYGAGGSQGNGDPASVGTVTKMTFSTDAKTNIPATLPFVRGGGATFVSSTHGYVAGGFRNSSGPTVPAVATANVDKFTFADDSRSLLATGLSAASEGQRGANSPTIGYVFSVSGNTAGAEKFTFSTDARSTTAVTLNNPSRVNSGTFSQNS